MKTERRKSKTKILITFLIVFICLFIIFYVLIGIYKENKIKLKETEKAEIQLERTVNEQEVKEKVNIQSTYSGYEVSAKLVIPKINLETYILKEYSKQAMDLSPTKFWGPDANEIGNFCITGHNYKKDNMFYDLINLSIGDEFELLDNKNGKYTYTIYDIYKVKPENTASLNQETNGKRIVTLITCVNYSNTRLIIKAVEKGNS